MPIVRKENLIPFHFISGCQLTTTNSDDPWNQTAADNFEWLQRFKRDVGILPPESGPGLGTSDHVAWAPSAGGTGFAPPYVSPNPSTTIALVEPEPEPTASSSGAGAGATTRFLRSLGTSRQPAPAKVFCSRELEAGLASYVRREMMTARGTGGGGFPSDDALRERARQIMGMQKTSCDDPLLLERFKAAVRADAGAGADGLDVTGGERLFSPGIASVASGAAGAAATASDPIVSDAALAATLSGDMEMDMDFHFTEQEMNDILQDVSPDFGSGTSLNPSPTNSGGGAGVGSGAMGLDFGL